MPSKTITFLSYKHLPREGGLIEVSFTFSILDTALVDAPDEHAETTYRTIIVKLPHSAQMMWGLRPPQVEKVMFEYARRYLYHMVAGGQEDIREMLDLRTTSVPMKCPFDPGNISMTLGESHVVS
jgi:hypothetical protein